MKFLFVILTQPEILDEPYRKIADHAHVALGNIGAFLAELKKEGLHREGHQRDKRNHYIDDKDRLIQRWTEAYVTNLRPRQLIGNFRFAEKENMKNWENLRGDFK